MIYTNSDSEVNKIFKTENRRLASKKKVNPILILYLNHVDCDHGFLKLSSSFPYTISLKKSLKKIM